MQVWQLPGNFLVSAYVLTNVLVYEQQSGELCEWDKLELQATGG